jgi:hypothetical protein
MGFSLYFVFACISGLGFWGFFHSFWVGASFVVWVLWGFHLDFGFYGGFGCCEGVSPCGFSSVC